MVVYCAFSFVLLFFFILWSSLSYGTLSFLPKTTHFCVGFVYVFFFLCSWVQCILWFAGTTSPEKMVVLGSHQDSTSNSPGADDDGSGSITNLEVLRVLMEDGFRPEQSLEIQWYAAEEVGLLGSRDMAQQYRQAGLNVTAMLQVDMDGNKGAYGVTIATGPNPISNYLADCIERFSGVCCGNSGAMPWRFGSAGGGSDHSSWIGEGYQGVFGIEDPKSPFLHTPNDTMENVDINYVAAYTPVVIGFVAETTAADFSFPGTVPPNPNFCDNNACVYAFDVDCDDGGAGSDYSLCDTGTDCQDCCTKNPTRSECN
jgi:hypothetical protein